MRLATALPTLVVALTLSACGDRRDPFFGMYEGNGVDDIAWSDGTSETETFGDRIYVTPAADGRRVLLSELCDLSATVEGGDELRIDPKQCNAYTVDVCTVTRTVDTGTGTLRGDVLALSYAGDLFVQCTDGRQLSARVSTSVTAGRR